MRINLQKKLLGKETRTNLYLNLFYFTKREMNTLKFKTNIKCKSCVAKVSRFLDENINIAKWNVDLESPDRILTVTGDNISFEFIKEVLLKAGYKAEELK